MRKQLKGCLSLSVMFVGPGWMPCHAAVIDPIVIPPDTPEPPESATSQMIIDVDVVPQHPFAWFQKFVLDRFKRFLPLVLLAACLLTSSAMYHYRYEVPATENTAYVQRIEREEIRQGAQVTIVKEDTGEREVVTGVIWGNEGHVIGKYSQLKGASQFSVELVDSESYPLSIHAIDEDLDVVIFKSDNLRQNFVDQKSATDPGISEPSQGVGVSFVPGASTRHIVSEILRDVHVKDIDTLIRFGTRVNWPN